MRKLFTLAERDFGTSKRAIVTLVAARLAALAIALALGASTATGWWSWTVAGLFSVTALSLALIKKQSEPTLLVRWLNTGVDIGVVSFLVLVSGGFASFASLLFLPVIALSHIGNNERFARQVSTVVALSFIVSGIGAGLLLSQQDAFSLNAFFGAGGILTCIAILEFGAQRIRKAIADIKQYASENFSRVEDLQKTHQASAARIKELEEEIKLQEVFAQRLATETEPKVAQRLLDASATILIAKSSVMQKVQSIVVRVAPTDATVLVTGESGTGKEVAARAIHELSNRSQKNGTKSPFVAVNCGAIPEQLLESELFGHKKGSFTGATSDSLGLFRKASGGTIFLDEIGELPMHMQVKLLRALQDRKVRPVGGDTDIEIDVRIIAATNRDLKTALREGKFREDLYFRLNVISVCLPPLRDRKEDMPDLIERLLQRVSGGDKSINVSPHAMSKLLAYRYPGNVRELENILSRAVVFAGDVLLPEHIGDLETDTQQRPERGFTDIITLDDVTLPVKLDDILGNLEKNYLLAALGKTNGAKKKAADLLGVNFRSFRYRLQKFDIEAEDAPSEEA